VILDPFAGSGTTCLVAARDQRHFIGYEVNQEYIELARTRMTALSS
jgi:site-specific DNA-methyltransferase (adenine-specific)